MAKTYYTKPGPQPKQYIPKRKRVEKEKPVGVSVAEVKRAMRLAARDHGDEMIQILCEVARNPDSAGASRVSAAREVLDRGYGRTKAAPEENLGNHTRIQVMLPQAPQPPVLIAEEVNEIVEEVNDSHEHQ